MPLLLRRMRGNSAARPGGRAPSFPHKRVGACKARTNGRYGKIELDPMNGERQRRTYGNEERYFSRKLRSSYVILMGRVVGQGRTGPSGICQMGRLVRRPGGQRHSSVSRLYPTVNVRRLSSPGRRHSGLEQSSSARHICMQGHSPPCAFVSRHTVIISVIRCTFVRACKVK